MLLFCNMVKSLCLPGQMGLYPQITLGPWGSFFLRKERTPFKCHSSPSTPHPPELPVWLHCPISLGRTCCSVSNIIFLSHQRAVRRKCWMAPHVWLVFITHWFYLMRRWDNIPDFSSFRVSSNDIWQLLLLLGDPPTMFMNLTCLLQSQPHFCLQGVWDSVSGKYKLKGKGVGISGERRSCGFSQVNLKLEWNCHVEGVAVVQSVDYLVGTLAHKIWVEVGSLLSVFAPLFGRKLSLWAVYDFPVFVVVRNYSLTVFHE